MQVALQAIVEKLFCDQELFRGPSLLKENIYVCVYIYIYIAKTTSENEEKEHGDGSRFSLLSLLTCVAANLSLCRMREALLVGESVPSHRFWYAGCAKEHWGLTRCHAVI